MSAGKANCLVCGKPLVYFAESSEAACSICGKKEFTNAACEDGHFICNDCHRSEGVEYIVQSCLINTSKNPIKIMDEAMDDKRIYPNGPEHHTLIGASLITSYANAGGTDAHGAPLEKGKALAELKKRSLQVPGGACGFWGTCGAATSAGQALSILNGSTPLTEEPWAQCQRLTSIILGRLADVGGPRCCKRTGYIAVLSSVPYMNKLLGSSMELPDDVVCRFFAGNAECKRQSCPFFPNADEHVKAAFWSSLHE